MRDFHEIEYPKIGYSRTDERMKMIIAEIGLNHQGDFNKAKIMIEKAKAAGANIAKFQWYDPVEVLGKNSPYLSEATACQLTWGQHQKLKKHCDKIGIEWLVSAFHARQIPSLVEAGTKRFKVASRAALDDELLRAIAKTGLPVILSTGLCDQNRLNVINNLLAACERTFLYCVCLYPTPADKIDLNEMDKLLPYAHSVGFSSHCPDIWPAMQALRRGASVIEQHVVLDKSQKGCDVSSSISFKDLKILCNSPILVPVETKEQVEWLRIQRSKPELYKYFRQDAPLSSDQQAKWWNNLDKTSVRLFLIKKNEQYIGYVGFNPLVSRAAKAEFGIFILPEYGNKNYGTLALKMLLRIGFEDYNLSTIYSDCLDYPNENRFEFYKKIGFEAFPMEHQFLRYKKQGKMIPSIKFFMTKDMWRGYGQDCHGGLVTTGAEASV